MEGTDHGLPPNLAQIEADEMASWCPVAAVWVAFYLFNLVYIRMIHPHDRKKLHFVAQLWPQSLLAVLTRYAVLCLGSRYSLLCCLLTLPISVWETTSLQAMADLYEGRPLKAPTAKQIVLQLKVAAVETLGYVLAFQIWPWLREDGLGAPPASVLLHAVWRTLLFDIGLDLGFYAFHRSCHVNRTLYRLVHAPHHAETGKEHGHLVAYETYELTFVETASILSSYLVGFQVLSLCFSFSTFDVALYVSWAHMIELLGHTEMSWTPTGHPQRLMADLCGLSLEVPHHTMHHQKPLSNFSKRLILFDLLFHTYEPPDYRAYWTRVNKAQPQPQQQQPAKGKPHLEVRTTQAYPVDEEEKAAPAATLPQSGSPLKPRRSFASTRNSDAF